MKPFKTFAVVTSRRSNSLDDTMYFINKKKVTKVSFKKRRLTECFHQWRPLGCSSDDGYCKDCQLMVVNGHKVLD